MLFSLVLTASIAALPFSKKGKICYNGRELKK